MDHQEAVSTEAAERYLLGQLTSPEREEFEQHFFECPECAEEVRSGAIFIANARVLFREKARRPAPGGLAAAASRFQQARPLVAFAVAAALLLVVLNGWLLLRTIPKLKQEIATLGAPQAYPAFFLRPVARGADQELEITKQTQFVGLWLDIPPGRAFASYSSELANEPGGSSLRIQSPAPARPGSPLHVLVPRSSLEPGRYVLILRGLDGAPPGLELNRFHFSIRFK